MPAFPGRTTSIRDTILYKTFDLFRSSSEVTCQTCGHHFRSPEAKKRSEVIRGEITSLFRDFVPLRDADLFGSDGVHSTCSEYLEKIGAFARFTLSNEASAEFIIDRLDSYLRGLDVDREEGAEQRRRGLHGDHSRGALRSHHTEGRD